MFELASRRRLWFAISLAIIIPGVISLLVNGLKLGIDFTGGTLWEISFDQPVSSADIGGALAENGFESSVIQQTGQSSENAWLIRIPELKEGSLQKQVIEETITEQVGPFVEQEFSTVGGAISSDIRNRSFWAIVMASIGVLLYIAYAFRNTQNPLLYGMCAIVAMLHDVLVVLGIFSILGWLFNVEIDALFVTALLTVIGFSVHDTIVVFDRIRENLGRHTDPTFEGIVNYSLAQTLVRSLNTSLTVVFTLLALYLFGGGSTRNFVLALLIGVISGTYSSIFNASQLLVAWEYHEVQNFFGRLIGRAPQPAPAR